MNKIYSIFLLVLLLCFTSTLAQKSNWIVYNKTNSGLPDKTINSISIDSSGNGVLLSNNNGTGWRAVNSGLTNIDITTLVTSGANLFVGTGSGIFLSTNNGTSWTAVNSGLTNTDVNSLVISGANLFAGTDSGVFLSTNNGTSWIAVNSGLTAKNVISLAISGTNLFAGTWGDGVFLSTNNGTSWTAVNSGLTGTTVHALVISGTNLFAGTNDGVFLLAYNDTSWTSVNSGLKIRDRVIIVNALAVSGTNLFAGACLDGVFLSTDNGISWTSVNSGLTNTDINAFTFIGTNLFVGTTGGVFVSTNNGVSWNAINTGLENDFIQCFAVSGTNLFTGSLHDGVFLSTNNGTSWITKPIFSLSSSSDSLKEYPSKWYLAIPVFGGPIYDIEYPEEGAKTHLITTFFGDFFGLFFLWSGISASSQKNEVRDNYEMSLNQYNSALSVEDAQSARKKLESAYKDYNDNRGAIKTSNIVTPLFLAMAVIPRVIELIWGCPDTQSGKSQNISREGGAGITLYAKLDPKYSIPMFKISIQF